MKRVIVYLGMILMSQNLFSQEGEEKEEQLQMEEPKQEVSNKLSNFTISGYTEVFYSYDFNQRADHIRQPFFYTFNRHNEVNVNIARLKAEYATDNMRANIALMAGTYPEDNLSAEQGMLKLVQEANIGFRISKTKNLWVDAGVMPSYIGSEGEISKDNLALTRTIAVAQEPFFMTGTQITYITDNNKWTFMGGVYNGWQIIKRQNSNTNLPAFGARVAYQPNEKWFFNSSAYIGKDPATETKMRYFNNFYTNYKASDKLEFQFVFDVGAEQSAEGSNKHYFWWSPNILAKYHFTPKFSTAGRVEYFDDSKDIMTFGGGQRFQIWGASVNFDYLINKNLMWRLEFRNLQSKDPIFQKIDQSHPNVKNNFFITTMLAAWF